VAPPGPGRRRHAALGRRPGLIVAVGQYRGDIESADAGGHGHARHALAPVAAVAAALLGFRSRWSPRRWRGHVDPMGPPVLARRVLCGSLQVPLNYAHRSGPTIALSVIEHPATEAPGDGVLLLTLAAGERGHRPPGPRVLFPPRCATTSLSSASTSAARHEQPASVWTLATAAASAVPFSAPASMSSPGCPPTVPRSTPGSLRCDHPQRAKDMDRIRAALGASQISYYGLPTAPASVRSMRSSSRAVCEPWSSTGRHTNSRSAGRRLRRRRPSTPRSAARCRPALRRLVSVGCPSLATYSALESRLLLQPAARPGGGDTTPVTVGDLFNATLLYLSSPPFRRLPRRPRGGRGGNGRRASAVVQFYEDVGGASLVAPEWA